MSSSSAANKSENILSQLGSPEAEPYVMNGTRGFCYACNLELTSLQHCNQHITGSKHLKKVKETTSTSFYNTDSNSVSGLGLSPNTEMFVPQANAPQFSINHLQNSVLHHSPFIATSEQSRLLSSSVANYSENILSQLGSPNAELYVMNGTRGFCYACNLELTSLQHCNQHITGSKHLKKVKETSTSFYNCNTNFTSGLGQGLATSASLQPFPPDRSQQAAPHQSPFSTSGQPMTRNPLSSIMPLKGPNGEAYVMNGTRGYCYVCGLELTSPEHAQSHLSGTKHKKKSGADTLSSMDTSLTNGKILMCSLCQVPFSCIKNAEEHFRSDKHKNKVANLPKDYSYDPEQTKVMKPYTTPGPKSSDNGDCKDQSNFVSSSHNSSAGLISPVEFTEILDKAKENKNTNSAPVEVVTKGENKFNNVHSSAASVLVTDKQGMTAALNSPKDGSLDRVIIGPEQLEVGSLRNTEMTDVRLSPIKDGLDKQQVELGAPPSVSPKNVNTKDNDNNLNASFHEVHKLKNKDVPTEERQACSELNSLTKDGQTLQSSIIDNAKQTGYMGSVSQSKSTVAQQLSAPVDFQESEQQMATSKNDHFVPASMDYLQHSHSQEDLQEFRDMNPSLTYHNAIDPAATQQLSVPLNSTQIKQQLATSDNGTSASMAYHQHSSFEELSQDLNVINPSLTNYNAIDSSVTQQLSAPFNSTQSKQQLATSHNITSASVDHLQHSNSQQFSQDIHVMNPSLLEHNSIDPEMQRTAHSQLPFHSNLQQSACPEHKSPTPNLLISQSTVPNEGMQHLQDDSRTEINENLKGYFSSSAVNSAQRSAIDKQPIKVQTQGHPQRVLYFSPSQDDIDKQQRIDKKATVACQSSHLKNINDKENKEKNFQNIEAHSKDVDIYVRTEAFPMTNKADVTSVEGAGHSASKEQHLRFMQQLPKAASNTEMNQTRLEENRNQIRQHLPESVSNAEMSQTRFVENRNQLMQQLPESVSNTEMNQTKFEGNRNQLTQQLPESVSNIPVNQMNSQKDHSNSESLAQQVTDTISHTPQQVTDTISHTPQQFTGTISHTPFNQVTFPGQQRQPFDCTQHLQESFSNLQINQFGSELPSSSESEEQYYYFNGSKGFCHACSIELTSFQHTNQHINGQKHQKKVQQMHFTKFLQKESKSPMAVSSDNLVSGVQSFPPLPQENCFMFDGNRGMCHVCQIELTSLQHATQHLNGKGHKRNVERRNLEKKGITYPLFCEVCNKSFTGTESAVQHFTSSKHKSKAQLLEINPFRDRKGDSVIIKDGLTWFICDVCQCRVNTREQLMKHKETLKHKELEDTLSRRETTQTPINLNVISGTPSELNGRYNDTRQEHILNSGNILQNSMYGETPKIVQVDAARQEHILADNQQHLTYGETPRICLDTSSPIALKYTSSLKSQEGVSLNQVVQF
ncbi:hypothetical protein Btru_006352 [Bulinus truncatus]|nr:hypothetical protein Btru_006352 [Bulinus truncatus]